MSRLFSFKKTQFIHASPEKVWEFIATPENLNKITPDSMAFKTISEPQGKMFPGMLISYIVKPFPFISFNWVTEITHVEPGVYFVDEQRFGPYSFWHHKHFIERSGDGTLMTDIVDYKVPFGFIGNIANAVVVRKKLEQIFSFRTEIIEKIFGKENSAK